jgi:hypothetical protein
MKTLTEKQSLVKLKRLKDDFQELIKTNYEGRAKDCLTCETKGACCLDAHFVNVHITRLEAVAIRETLEKLPKKHQREIYKRNDETIEMYDLKSSGDTLSQTFACPLFEKETGCLVHKQGKPAPCIQHACYENKKDLPPDDLQTNVENKIERLNKRTYGNAWNWLPLPVWLQKL